MDKIFNVGELKIHVADGAEAAFREETENVWDVMIATGKVRQEKREKIAARILDKLEAHLKKIGAKPIKRFAFLDLGESYVVLAVDKFTAGASRFTDVQLEMAIEAVIKESVE